MRDGIRPLNFEDQKQIENLAWECLQNKDNITVFPIAPTKKNSQLFYRLEIFPLLLSENPAFGFFSKGELQGLYCCTISSECEYETQYPLAIGGITVVKPSQRRLGIGTKLRNHLIDHLKKMKIERFIFEIKADNTASFSNAINVAKAIGEESNVKIISFRGEAANNVY